MGETEMTQVAALLASVLREETDARTAREKVRELTSGFPPYPGR
jgi:glycine hydroxymethyltransferase